ncbi:MAG: hypothetical protein ACOY4H_04340, partial [Thermodesulfobacteriota bacterium]
HGDRLLQLYFSAQKAVSKAQKQDKFQLYLYKISKLIRSDPVPYPVPCKSCHLRRDAQGAWP